MLDGLEWLQAQFQISALPPASRGQVSYMDWLAAPMQGIGGGAGGGGGGGVSDALNQEPQDLERLFDSVRRGPPGDGLYDLHQREPGQPLPAGEEDEPAGERRLAAASGGGEASRGRGAEEGEDGDAAEHVAAVWDRSEESRAKMESLPALLASRVIGQPSH